MPTLIQDTIKTSISATEKPIADPTFANGKAATYDRFRLGWRIRPRVTEEGRIVHEQIPLTSYDILHPQEDDFRVHNHEHMSFCNYLVDVFQSRVAGDPYAVVLHDTRVTWDEAGPSAHGPDVALIFGVRAVKKWAPLM